MKPWSLEGQVFMRVGIGREMVTDAVVMKEMDKNEMVGITVCGSEMFENNSLE